MSKNRKKPKIVVIVGPTAIGKSSLAVELAKKFDGEIISADSRQVYKGLDIGTGKITKKEMRGVPHHMLDVANPKRKFSVVEYKKISEKILSYMIVRNKLPIVVGGTGFYIQALVDNITLPEVPPNPKLRKKLEKKNTEELFKILKKLDPKRSGSIDRYNPRRLIRAIEIAKHLGFVPKSYKLKAKSYDSLFIGLDSPDRKLKERIKKRLNERIRQGMIAEARKLHKEGLSYKRMRELGLEYKYLADFLDPPAGRAGKKITKEEMIEQLETAIWQYAKRQRTWFKRDKRIKWIKPSGQKKIEKEIERFLRNLKT